MADVASQAEIFVTIAGQGAALKKLERVKSIDIKDNRSTEVVMAVGVQRGAGFRRKQGGFEMDMDVYDEVGRQPEVDWDRVNDSRATFTIVTQSEGNGFRYSYVCQVSKVDRKFDDEGNNMKTVSVVATQMDRS